jgi:hypothetical protein
MSEEKKIGYVFQFAANVADGMSLTISGNFAVGDSTETMNAEVDRLRSVMDRQRAKNEVPLLEAQVEEVRRRREASRFDLEQHMKLPPNKVDRNLVARVTKMIEEFDTDIERGEMKLKETVLRAA